MNEQTLIALKGSIAKWEGIVAGTETDRGPHNCPLCQLFHASGCGECPVFIKTGWSGCYGTPYYAYMKASSPLIGGRHNFGAITAAQQEVDFLRSLLPAEPSKSHPILGNHVWTRWSYEAPPPNAAIWARNEGSEPIAGRVCSRRCCWDLDAPIPRLLGLNQTTWWAPREVTP